MESQPELELLVRDNLLEMATLSIDTRMFNRLWVLKDGKRVDIVRGGQIACARFVSGVLLLCSTPHARLIGSVHATVSSTVADMLGHGWHEIPDLRVGCVLEWEAAMQADGAEHGHLGFYIGGDEAISYSDRNLASARHALNMMSPKVKSQTPRTVVKRYWHPALD
jgi:hypothetical protein